MSVLMSVCRCFCNGATCLLISLVTQPFNYPQNSASCLILLLPPSLFFLPLTFLLHLSWWFYFFHSPLSELLGHINNLTSSNSKRIMSSCAGVCVHVCVWWDWLGKCECSTSICQRISKVIALTSVSGGVWIWTRVEGNLYLRTHTHFQHTHTRRAVRLICVAAKNPKLHLHFSCSLAHFPPSFMAA